MNRNRIYFIGTMILFLFLFIIYNPIFQSYPSDSNTYIKGVIENNIDFFDMPLLYFIGQIIEPHFWILPFVCLMGTLISLYIIFERKNLNYLYCPVLLLIYPAWMSFVFTFHRDSLFLFFSALTLLLLYYFNEEKNLNKKIGIMGIILSISVLSMLNKIGGQALLLLVICYLLYHLIKDKKIFYAFIPLSIRINWYFKEYITAINLWAWTTNFIFIFLFLNLFKRPNIQAIGLFSAIFISSFFVSGLGYDLVHVYRYTFFYAPFAIFYIAKADFKWLFIILFPLISILDTIPYFLWLLTI